MAEAERQPLPKTAFNDFKLKIIGPKQDGSERNPTLSVAVIKNQPRIDVYTNIPNAKDNGRISAPMDTYTFVVLLDELQRIIDGPADDFIKVTNRTGRPEDMRVLSTTIVGKDSSGKVYMSVTAQEQAKIKFVFGPTDYHSFARKDGTVPTDAELSIMYAKAFVDAIRQLTYNVKDTYYTEPDFQRQASNRQYDNSGYGNGSKPGQGYKKSDYQKRPTASPDNDGFPM
ncbi:MAG: hypothetical protein IBX57_00195 [Gammaproteobacteria bacterium]|nr:hypothetical protein [Gammaproteobacteria bacterium]